MGELTHFDAQGNARMVDVSEKADTERMAIASGTIRVCREILEAIAGGTVNKGDVLTVAQVAGIMGAKRTSELIPMCHIIKLTGADLTFSVHQLLDGDGVITARCKVRTVGKTGVEMEALTGVSSALLTIYDMCKAIDKHMVIGEIRLLEKDGGKSGHFNA